MCSSDLGTLEWLASGGRSGGCLRVTRTGPGEIYLVAPSAFFGNWSSASVPGGLRAGKFWLDYFPSPQSAPPTRAMTYEVSGPAGSSSGNGIYYQSVYSGVWSAVAMFNWSQSPALENVTQVKVRLGLDVSLPVGEVMLIDNIGYKSCSANCDGSTGSPVLTANDFQCFLNAVARNDSYANFDGISVNNAEDFQAFLNNYAVGCSGS